MAFLQSHQLQPENLPRFIARQQDHTQQQEQIIELKELIEVLEAETRRLKKLPAKPDIKPNTKPPDDDPGRYEDEEPGAENNDEANSGSSQKRKVKKPNENTRQQRKQPPKSPAEASISIAVTDVPQGSTRNGTTPFHVQELTIQTSSFKYLLEQWVTADGQTIKAKPPADLHGHHYGPVLQAYILHQYRGCSVTQPELLEWLWDIGLSISSGELSQLLTQGHEQFHSEKTELPATGIRCSSYIQTDDTGTRHQEQNGYCTIINNESFARLKSTGSLTTFNDGARQFGVFKLPCGICSSYRELTIQQAWHSGLINRNERTR
ncbi:hypothetical protein GZ77_21810 [Endozoicomonas montiporae]|uniref:Uncharacterized protein n=2 Tax=Endozoicomonas montiporae TaxID=1027273 RepID=A0A081N3M2_9GAMM|nr:hypothetical protein [Endozoicomonas montiporae]AMO58361.1 nucleoside-triphosphatase-like protein [Endozoicomonas montiporae CL-33]KEQ13045.1 hypothetical protein GZ77_21810 [Endozoicomonas montiporae]